MKWRIFLLITLATIATTMVASLALAQQGPPLQAQEHAKPKADLNLPEAPIATQNPKAEQRGPAKQELPKGIEDAAPVEDLTPSGEIAPAESKAAQHPPIPGSEQGKEHANLAPSGDNCTFEGGRTNCVTRERLPGVKVEPRQVGETTLEPCTQGRRSGFRTVTPIQNFQIVTFQVTKTEYAGRSGHVKNSTTTTETEETAVGNLRLDKGQCITT